MAHDPIAILTEEFPALKPLTKHVDAAFALLHSSYQAGGKLLLCGNGGSAADCEHWAGELLKGFEHPRPLPEAMRTGMAPSLANELQWALPAIPLTGITGYGSAWCNDKDPAYVYAQLMLALGKPGDVLAALSTSGNAQNVLHAARTARARGMKILALTGEDGGELAPLADVAIRAPARVTASVQQYHLPIYHCICRLLENAWAADFKQ